MSKPDKPVKSSAISQLKKDLRDTGKVIQSLASSVEKLESGFSDAEAALFNERSLKEDLSLAKRDLTQLQEAHHKVQNERQGEIAKFADVNLELTREYEIRSTRLRLEYESKLEDCQRHKEVMESRWKQKVDLEKAETQRLKQVESQGRHNVETQLQEAQDSWQKNEEQLQISLRKREHQINELLDRNKALTKELSESETILKGRDTEMQKLGAKFAALEAFPPQDEVDKLTDVIAKLQINLREFCLWCFDSAEIFPGWNKFPDGIWCDHLPRLYSEDSASSRHVFVAALQHSICTAMQQNFLPPFGPCSDRGFWDVSKALFRSNPSHEAIWRLMTVNTILSDQQMKEKYRANLRGVAESLLSSWKPFPGASQEKETLDRLTRLLSDIATTSLQLQKLRKRIHASIDVVSQYFDSDSEDEAHNIPGGFELPDSAAAVLCLFPAFFWTTSAAATSGANLLRIGTAMFRDSPPLLAALKEEPAVRSPKMSNKRRPNE